MTIKNTKKNISAEDGEIVQSVSINAATKSNNVSNFSNNQTVTVTSKDFYEEGNLPVTRTFTIPISELVRLGYLQDKYYDKTYCDATYYTKEYVDAHIRLHYKVLNSKPNMTNKQWAESVRLAGEQNYIFLIPFGTDYENDNSDQTDQDGYYIEYFYSIEDNDTTFQTEKMERRGSTKISLVDYLKIANLDTELQNLVNANTSSSYKTLNQTVNSNVSRITNLENNKLDKDQTSQNANGILTTNSSGVIQVSPTITKSKISDFSHAHGNISNEGVLSTTVSTLKNIVVTNNSDNKVCVASTIPSSKITNPALSNLATQNNATLQEINTALNTKIGTMVQDISTLQTDLTTLANNVYTKAEINAKIGSIEEMQLATLAIL